MEALASSRVIFAVCFFQRLSRFFWSVKSPWKWKEKRHQSCTAIFSPSVTSSTLRTATLSTYCLGFDELLPLHIKASFLHRTGWFHRAWSCGSEERRYISQLRCQELHQATKHCSSRQWYLEWWGRDIYLWTNKGKGSIELAGFTAEWQLRWKTLYTKKETRHTSRVGSAQLIKSRTRLTYAATHYVFWYCQNTPDHGNTTVSSVQLVRVSSNFDTLVRRSESSLPHYSLHRLFSSLRHVP